MVVLLVSWLQWSCAGQGVYVGGGLTAPLTPQHNRWSPEMMVLTACISTAMFGNGQPFSWQEAPATSNSLLKDETQQMI